MSSGRYILDEFGNPVECSNLMEWGYWFENHRRDRQLAYTTVDDIMISTIFLGLDFFAPINIEHVPILWETWVSGRGYDSTQRYSARQAALNGHYETVEIVMSSMPRNHRPVVNDMRGVSIIGVSTVKESVTRRIKP